MPPSGEHGAGSEGSGDLSALTGLPSHLSRLEAHGIDLEVAYKKFFETKDNYELSSPNGSAQLISFIVDAYLKAQMTRSCLSVSNNGYRSLASPVRLHAASNVGDSRRTLPESCVLFPQHPQQQPNPGQGEHDNGDEHDCSNPRPVPLPDKPSPSPRQQCLHQRGPDLDMNTGVHKGRDDNGRTLA
ncbi:hypothetical protein ColTof4_13550 [Colletotrichum tofieldiae]|nr:hypothetical protein ColTof4_13550 [Colletotrichum tofieldiae]